MRRDPPVGQYAGAISRAVAFGIDVAIISVTVLVVAALALGETPGDMLMGLRIVRTDGKRMNLRRALLRYVGCLLAALPLFLGFLWILVDERRQGWHDKIAGTYVLYTAHDSLRQSIAHRPPPKRAHG